MPLTRDLRPARTIPPAALPPAPAPAAKRPSRAWLFALVPVALVALTGTAGFGVAVNLPSPPTEPSPEPARTLPRPELLPPPAVETPPSEARLPDEPPPAAVPVLPRALPPVLALAEMKAREIEVVFCLDTTGSMGGLLRAAQRKVWAICSQVAGGRPTPLLKVGLVAYRDRGDDYVTKVTPLSRDLDAVYQELLGLKAAGGGDTPESVNEALDVAVNRVRWSTDSKTARIIFLVGDAPPHMDYRDDVKYPDTCKKAVEKGILVNTVQCGSDAQCARHWKQIAVEGGGEYVAIPQGGGVREVTTPFDGRLAELLGELMDTAQVYGGEAQKRAGEAMVKAARSLRGASAADRAAFAARSRRLVPNDLLDDLAAKRVRLEEVKEAELPAALRKLKRGDRKAYVGKVAARRAKVQEEVLGLEKKRAEHMKRVGGAGKDGFDMQVLSVLRKQVKRFGIEY